MNKHFRGKQAGQRSLSLPALRRSKHERRKDDSDEITKKEG
jgi:hypothetical protein